MHISYHLNRVHVVYLMHMWFHALVSVLAIANDFRKKNDLFIVQFGNLFKICLRFQQWKLVL